MQRHDVGRRVEHAWLAAALALGLALGVALGAVLAGNKESPGASLLAGAPGAVQAESLAAELAECDVVAQLCRDGSWRVLPDAAVATPTDAAASDTPQPAPTLTPTTIPSITYTPELTPTPAATRTPSPAPDDAPTQERTPPPPATPAPGFKTCTLKAGSGPINKRAGPEADYPRLPGSVETGATVDIDQFARGRDHLWARAQGGAYWWAVGRWDTTKPDGIDWWAYGLDVSALCDEVPGWPEGLEPPAPIVRAPAWGVWAGPGAPLGELIAFGQRLHAAGMTPVATLYGMDAAAPILRAYGWVIALRPWIGGANCPEFTSEAEGNARAWVDRAVAAAEGVPHDWLVISNECVAPTPDYTARWIRAAIARAAACGERQVVPWVFPPGHPALEDVPVLAAAYAGAPIVAAWGLNLYPTEPGRALGDRGGINEWTVWRWRLYRHQLPPAVPLVVTEFARGDGSEPPDVADLAQFVERAGDAFEWATAWYAAGESGLGHWPAANLRGRLGELANALNQGG